VDDWGRWAIVALAGFVVGVTEIVGIYRDAPVAALAQRLAGLYVALNVAAAMRRSL